MLSETSTQRSIAASQRATAPAAAAPSTAPPKRTGGLYALELVRSGAILPREAPHLRSQIEAAAAPRRDLPEEAFGRPISFVDTHLSNRFGDEDAERRFSSLFIGVSWRWLSNAHPDPDGRQLGAIATVASAYLDAGNAVSQPIMRKVGGPPHTWRDATVRHLVFEPLNLKGKEVDCAFFIDFACLPHTACGPDMAGCHRRIYNEAKQALLMYLAYPGIALWMPSEQHITRTRRGGATKHTGSKERWEYGGCPLSAVARAQQALPPPPDLSQRCRPRRCITRRPPRRSSDPQEARQQRPSQPSR